MKKLFKNITLGVLVLGAVGIAQSSENKTIKRLKEKFSDGYKETYTKIINK